MLYWNRHFGVALLDLQRRNSDRQTSQLATCFGKKIDNSSKDDGDRVYLEDCQQERKYLKTQLSFVVRQSTVKL